MSVVLFWLGLGMMVLGITMVIKFDALPRVSRVGGKIGIVGVILAIVATFFLQFDDAADRQARTNTVIDTVAESHHVIREGAGCVQVFTLDNTTFEMKCESIQPLKQGDTLEIEFLLPKNWQGQPEVLKVRKLSPKVGIGFPAIHSSSEDDNIDDSIDDDDQVRGY